MEHMGSCRCTHASIRVSTGRGGFTVKEIREALANIAMLVACGILAGLVCMAALEQSCDRVEQALHPQEKMQVYPVK